MTQGSLSGERGSAASVVALLLLAALMALAAYVAWGLFLTPQLLAVRPDPVAAKTTVTLHGGRFAPSPGQNIVLFGDQTGRVIRATPSELDAVVPDLGLPPGRQARVPVRVLVDGRASDSLELTIGVVPLPVPTPEPTPAPEAAASPEPAPVPEATAPAGPGPSPSAASPAKAAKAVATPAPPVESKLLHEAEVATGARDFERAALLYERALKDDPASTRAQSGLEEARIAVASLARTFVLGKTQVEGVPARGGVKSFDTRDVSVRKPAEVPGRLEMVAAPERVRPGDGLNVKVFLLNEGKKPIRLQSMNLATTLDDVRQSGPAAPLVREVAPAERALIAEVANEWKPVARRWRLEVQVVSDRGETYTNILSWR